MSNSAKPPENSIPNWLGNDSEMATRIRAFDWSTTPLGSLEAFPQSLRSALSIMLASKAHMAIFWGTDLIKFYNDAYVTLIGANHPAILGQPARECWREIWDVLGPMLNRVMETGEGKSIEDGLFTLDRHGYSEEAYFDVFYDPIRDESGKVGGVFCIVKEMTRRVVGDRRLQTLRNLSTQTISAKTADAAYHSATEVLNSNTADLPFSLLYRLDADGKAYLSSATDVQLSLKSRLEIVDFTCTPTPLQAVMAQVVKTGQPEIICDLSAQLGADLPDCSLGALTSKPHTAIAVPLSRSDGQSPIGVLIAGVSPFLALDSAYQDFVALVAASITTGITNASAYEEERQRAEALAQLDHAKTSFFSNISHEFRTPLTLMLSPLEQTIAQFSDSLPAQARSHLELVQRNGTRLLKLVNTLLDFSRIEAGRRQAYYEPTDLTAYTVELASLFQSTIEQAGLQFQVDCLFLPAPVYVDREMWEKIVSNLLSNAFKFTFKGVITIALHQVDDQIELSVRDTGTGIPAAEIPHLFERFHRVEGAQGRTFEGTGIGLSLVQELVQLQGGTISVESTVGQGSTFRVRLPLRTAPQVNPSTRLDNSPAIPASANSYVQEALGWLPENHSKNNELSRLLTHSETQFSSPSRILIVDDNLEMRNYLFRILSSFYEIEAVANGEAALAAADDRPPDLILSDVMMPGINGFELLKQFRSNPQTRDLPILLLSARAGEESAVKGLEAGADDYLVKPFSTRELLARVSTNLELGRSRRTAARRRLDAIVSSVSDFIYTFDLAGRFTYINQPLLDLWQKSYAEAIDKNFFELDYPPELAAQLQQQIQQVITTRQPLKDETPYTSVFGTRVYEYIFVPLFDTDGLVCGVAGTSRDITDRKQAEAMLRSSHDTFRHLVENSPFGVLTVDADFRLSQVSIGAQKVFENVDPSIGRDYAEVLRVLWPEPFATEVIAIFRHTLETGEPYRAPSTVERRFDSGEVESYDWQIERITLPDGRFGIVGYFYDLSERQRYESALRASEERSRLAIGIAQLGTWRYNLDTNCVELDERMCEIWGQPKDAMTIALPQAIEQIAPMDQARVELAVGAALDPKSNGTYEIEYRIVRNDGSERWIFANGQAQFEGEGASRQAVQFIGTALDITDRKQAEVEREQMLRREQSARGEAERANRIKDEFLAVLSHELRTPLNPILGWSKLLQSRALDSKKTAYALDTIERNARLQSQLIEDLLDVSRILQGKLTLNVAPVNLASTIKSAIETVRLAAEAKHIVVELVFDSTVELVSGDAGRLQQVVWNLLSNAVKFTPDGGVVKVRLSQLDRHVQLDVIDTGKGISPDFLPYVFEHFRQEDSATTRKFGGLGLGLAIARQIVELHGGTVKADSAGDGQGATFTVCLPALQTSRLATSTIVAERVRSNALTGLRILIVDDETDARELVQFILEEEGAIVTSVASALEALEVFRQSQIDVLISDIGMPDLDGYSLIKQIRSEQTGHSPLPAIALTAYAGDLDQQKAREAGFAQYLSKPLDSEALLAAVLAVVRGL